ETQIAEGLQISRTPVRQALGLLLQEGLVEVGPRRQLIVRGFTPEHQEEIQMLREALERVAVRRACQVMEVEDIDEMRLLLMRQRRAAAAGGGGDVHRLHDGVHAKNRQSAPLPVAFTLLCESRGLLR